MKKYNVNIQCTSKSGAVGDFLTDSETGEEYSPVFRDLCNLYDWCRNNGLVPYDWGYVSAESLGLCLVKI